MYHCFSACSDGLDRGQQRKGSAGEEFFQAASDAGGILFRQRVGNEDGGTESGRRRIEPADKNILQWYHRYAFYRGLHSRTGCAQRTGGFCFYYDFLSGGEYAAFHTSDQVAERNSGSDRQKEK